MEIQDNSYLKKKKKAAKDTTRCLPDPLLNNSIYLSYLSLTILRGNTVNPNNKDGTISIFIWPRQHHYYKDGPTL